MITLCGGGSTSGGYTGGGLSWGDGSGSGGGGGTPGTVFTPIMLTDEGVIGLSPVDNFFYTLENERAQPVFFAQNEKQIIRTFPQLIYIAWTIIDKTGEKPDAVYLLSAAHATWNPNQEDDEQAGIRQLHILGFSSFDQLHQPPFTSPGLPILSPLLYIQNVSREATVLGLLHPDWSKSKCLITAVRNITSGFAHFVLDVFGLIPGAGELSDAVNGGIYLIEGDNTNAGLSFAGMLPIGGQLATVGRWAKKGLKATGGLAFESAEGLVWASKQYGSDPNNVHALNHVYRHFQNLTNRPIHGIFTIPTNDLVELVDEAWIKVQNNTPGVIRTVQNNGNISYLIPMGRNIGIQGGSAGSGAALDNLRLVIDGRNANHVYTAYPE